MIPPRATDPVSREAAAPSPATAISERIRRGEHTLVLGALPPLDRDLTLVRVPCGRPSARAPLERATAMIDGMLGSSSTPQPAGDELAAYRRVLEGTPFEPSDVRFVDA